MKMTETQNVSIRDNQQLKPKQPQQKRHFAK